MNTKQLIILSGVQIVLAALLPLLAWSIIGPYDNTIDESNAMDATVYRMIFQVGMATVVVLNNLVVGWKDKFQWHGILAGLVFLMLIFIKNFDRFPLLSLVLFSSTFIVLYIKLPWRRHLLKTAA